MNDVISRQQAIEAVQNRHMMLSKEKVLLINDLEKLPPAKSETFKWCTDCKEYDQEQHCCHRFSKAIRQAVEEMQIVHCIECRYSEYDSYYNDRYCHYDGKAELVDDYHFCRNGEK